MVVDYQSEISFFLIPQGTLPWQPIIVGFIHRTNFCHTVKVVVAQHAG